MQTKRFVKINVKVILTWQICGQPSNMCGGSQRRALEFYLSESKLPYILISKGKEDCHLGLCIFGVIACREPVRNAKFRFFLLPITFFFRSHYCTAALFTQVPRTCTDLDPSLLYLLMLATYGKRTQKNEFLALGVCFPQTCSSAGRMSAGRFKITFTLLLTSFSFLQR